MPCARNIHIISVLFVATCILTACSAKKSPSKPRMAEGYDFANPKVINLPQSLEEISGITYYPKDTSVFAIIDEDGILFKISLNDPKKVRQWRFGKPRDYEDVVLRDSTFYVLVSNGDLEQLKFDGDKINVEQTKFPDASKKVNEFESLYYDPASGKTIMMCKQCEEDKKSRITSFFLNDTTKEYNLFSTIETAPILQKLGLEKEKVKPSAAAVNPITKNLYILCSVNKILVIQDAQGNIKDVIKLDPKLYKQPEGMTFTPQGDLIISNEYFLEGDGTLLLLKNKKPA